MPRIVRTRTIVAIAALIAVVALVAGPNQTGARNPSVARPVDGEQFQAVPLGLPAGTPLPEGAPVTSITIDTASSPSGWLGPHTLLARTGAPPVVVATRVPAPRSSAAQASVRVKPKPRFVWHFDGSVSWYGPGMYGSRTACGIVLTRQIRGVASPTLPCGTLVTFRANGRTITVPVIDRGPYVAGRIWDLSAGTCTYLHNCYTGSISWAFAI